MTGDPTGDPPVAGSAGGHPVRQLDRPEEEAALLSTLLAGAPVGFALIDTDLRFRRINERLAEMNGFTVQEHLGRAVFELLPQLRESAEPLLRRVLDGEPLVDVLIAGETPARPGVERAWRESFFPVRLDDGTPVGIAAVATEVTEQRALEQELQRTLALLEAVLASAPVGVAVFDTDLRFTRINDALAAMNGRPAAEHLGRRISELVDGPTEREIEETLRQVLASGEPRLDVSMTGSRRPGDVVEVLGHYFPVEGPGGPGGPVGGVGVVVVDVTERNRLQRLAEDSLRRTVEHQGEALEQVQRTLLPELCDLPGVEVDAAYVGAESVVRLGGDWYDCFELDGDRVVVAVGDAVGHGLAAVRIMDFASNVLRGLLASGSGPGEALARANRAMVLHRGEFATVCVAVLDRRTGDVELASAGHLPPLHVHTGGVDVVGVGSGPPLGPFPDAAFPSVHVRLAAGERLVLYTDGVVERRGEPLDVGIARLADAVRAAGPHRPGCAHDLVAALRDGEVQDDDSCLLVLTRSAPTP